MMHNTGTVRVCCRGTSAQWSVIVIASATVVRGRIMAMVSYNDRALERQSELLDGDNDSGEITDDDHAALRDFMDYDSSENKPGTVVNHMVKLRKVAGTDVTLVDADTDELVDTLQRFKSGAHPAVKDDGVLIGNYVSALRKFYQYHPDLNVDGDTFDVAEDYDGRELSASDLLYKGEVDDYLTAARRRSIRDVAMVALLLATGQRVDAIRTLRWEHVTVDGATMEVKLNEEEGDLKGAKGSKPLLWAKHYVRPWYESHPHHGDDSAAFFPSKRNGHNDLSADANGWSTEPIGKSQFRRIIKDRASEAGIEKDVYPHLLRHCAITRMAAQGDLSDQQIKGLVGWGGDSSQFETYVHLADDIATDSIRESMGVPTSDSGAPVVGRPSLETCPNCGDELPDGTERCRTCKTPMTQAEAQRQEEGGSDDLEELTQLLDDASDDELGAAVRQYLQGD